MRISLYKLFFLFCFFFFSFFSSGFLDSQDGLQYLTIARRIYYDATFEMPSARYEEGRTNIHMNVFRTKDGKQYAPTGLGYSLALIPAVAIEELLLSSQGLQPLDAFPLQNDWPFLFAASMTNAFFGGLLAVFLAKLLCLYGFSKKESAWLAFIFLIGTNLFVYTKHSFAHILFISFLMMTFYYLKLFLMKGKKKLLIFSVLSFGVVLIAYNTSYLFTLPSIGIFYFTHKVTQKDTTVLKKVGDILRDILLSCITLFPFYSINQWFLSFRQVDQVAQQLKYNYFTWLKPYVLLEGFWGILFSPGKSIFLFSPILLILLIFGFRLNRKKYWKEILSFGILFVTFFFFIGTLLGAEDYLLWHGDSSYGNRYMLVPLPFLLILVAFIYKELSKRAKLFIFYPLLILGLCIELVGILVPYQVRFGGLQTDTYFNGRNFNVYEYGNIIPRYSPIFTMSKILVKRLKHSREYFSHGTYNIKFKDGFDYPYDLGWSVWRSIHPQALISLNDPKDEITKVALQIRNHQIDEESSYSAQVTINANKIRILPSEEKIIELEGPLDDLLRVQTTFLATSSSMLPKQQVLFLQAFWINNVPQNLKTIDYPYVSPLSQAVIGSEYTYWGNEQTDPWSIWHMHSGVYEQTYDLWWMRPFHYWDIPKEIMYLGLLNFAIMVYLGYRLVRYSE